MSTLFVGLGRMGLPMVRRYAVSHDVLLHDADPDVLRQVSNELNVPTWHDVSDLSAVDVVILMLPSSSVIETVLEVDPGLLARLCPQSLVIDMSSARPESTQRLADQARQRGIGYVDAPVSGGVAKAITGELSIMIGGVAEDVQRAQPHLHPFGASFVHVGPSGSGHAAKALNNLLSATNIAAAAEVLAVATRFGIEPDVMVEVINSSTGRSQASEIKFPKHILTQRYDSGFAFDLMLKDIGIATALADATQMPLEVTAAAARTAGEAAAAGALDHTELARHVVQRAKALDSAKEHSAVGKPLSRKES